MTLRVADLFCGGGGISEGLRQAGLRIVYATDKARAAALTFEKNHPDAQVEIADVSELDAQSIPEFDILVGGPPCIEFSASKGNRGNILEGLRLVQAYLRVVYERDPRYWIMENVPRIILHLPEDIPLRWIGIDEDGFLHVPVRAEFNCAEYGVPQARKRFLMGNFPLPDKTSYDPSTDSLFGQVDGRSPWRSLGDVVDSFPDPISGSGASEVQIADPNYDISLNVTELTDHFHTVALNKRETRSIRRAKESHPYMGFMPFPDRRNVPARTVVATQLGRETLVLASEIQGETIYRRATIRECASLQTFPTSYQFFGNSLGARYRIVGDAVPPRLSYLIGREILKREGIELPLAGPIVQATPVELSHKVVEKRRKRPDSPMRWGRKFSELVPGKEVRGCRVELDNQGEDPADAGGVYSHESHLAEWTARLYVGEGKQNLRSSAFSFVHALGLIAPACIDEKICRPMSQMLKQANKELPIILSDATTLQAVWTNRSATSLGPEEIVDKLSEMVDEVFPKACFSNSFIPTPMDGSFLPKKGLRIRLAAGLVITAYTCEYINALNPWVIENPEKRFIPEEWNSKKTREKLVGRISLDPVTMLATAVNIELERGHPKSKSA